MRTESIEGTLIDISQRKEDRAFDAARDGCGGKCESRQERIPGQHESRNSHTDERHYRHDGTRTWHRPESLEQRDYLETVHRSADALLTVINDILDFSKIEAHKLDIEAIDFDLAHCIDETVRLLAPPCT